MTGSVFRKWQPAMRSVALRRSHVGRSTGRDACGSHSRPASKIALIATLNGGGGYSDIEDGRLTEQFTGE
jgi:hypothetical protein